MKKVLSLLMCSILILSLSGCSMIKDKKVLKEVQENEIEMYEEEVKEGIINKGEYNVYIDGDTLVIEEHLDSDIALGWRDYNIFDNTLVDILAERSEMTKEILEMKGATSNCHVKIITKDFNTNTIFITVQDGQVLYNFFN